MCLCCHKVKWINQVATHNYRAINNKTLHCWFHNSHNCWNDSARKIVFITSSIIQHLAGNRTCTLFVAVQTIHCWWWTQCPMYFGAKARTKHPLHHSVRVSDRANWCSSVTKLLRNKHTNSYFDSADQLAEAEEGQGGTYAVEAQTYKTYCTWRRFRENGGVIKEL